MTIDYAKRLSHFLNQIQATVDLVFLPISADLHYLTGIPREFPNFGAVLHPGAWLEGMWVSATHAPIFTLSRMTAELGGKSNDVVGDVRILGDWDDPFVLVRQLLNEFNLPSAPRVAVSERHWGESLINLQKLLTDVRFVSATDLLRSMRTIKTPEEITYMSQAGAITEAAFADVIQQLKLGMTELEAMREVDYQLKKRGALGSSFQTAFYNSGPNYPLMLGETSRSWHRKLEAPMSVLFDFGAVYEDYCYDFGRTVAFGEPSAEQVEVHRLVMASQQAGIAALRVGHTAEDADRAARQVLIEAGRGDAFRHRLGHGIGLDVHEPPFLTQGDTTPLQEGMLFTAEPSLLYDRSFSARVEDVVVVRPTGGEPLTQGFQDLTVIA